MESKHDASKGTTIPGMFSFGNGQKPSGIMRHFSNGGKDIGFRHGGQEQSCQGGNHGSMFHNTQDMFQSNQDAFQGHAATVGNARYFLIGLGTRHQTIGRNRPFLPQSFRHDKNGLRPIVLVHVRSTGSTLLVIVVGSGLFAHHHGSQQGFIGMIESLDFAQGSIGMPILWTLMRTNSLNDVGQPQGTSECGRNPSS